MDIREVQRSLLQWYDANKRDLPWRRTRDPYAILVSEVMCQQTRVDVVVPYYNRWMAKWPTVESLADANEEDVMAMWSGLGYYRRARNLHATAKRIASDGWPNDLRELPGVGPYIAGAVASMAFGHPVIAVDGNVQRVLSRLGNVQDDVTKGLGRNAIATLAEQLLDAKRPGDWAQAVMELGATICAPSSPDCAGCPVQGHCQADAPETLPIKGAKRPPIDQDVHFAAVVERGALLLVRRPDEGLLARTWGLPGGSMEEPLERLVQEQTRLTVQVEEGHECAEHVFSHRRWKMQVHRAKATNGALGSEARWVPLDQLEGLGISTAMRKALQAIALESPQAH